MKHVPVDHSVQVHFRRSLDHSLSPVRLLHAFLFTQVLLHFFQLSCDRNLLTLLIARVSVRHSFASYALTSFFAQSAIPLFIPILLDPQIRIQRPKWPHSLLLFRWLGIEFPRYLYSHNYFLLSRLQLIHNSEGKTTFFEPSCTFLRVRTTARWRNFPFSLRILKFARDELRWWGERWGKLAI